MAVISFTAVNLPYGWMGNMYAAPISYNGQLYRTSEALFQALRFEDPQIREEIRAQASPMAAKMKAKSYNENMIIDPMSEEDITNMKLCLQLKFDQHPNLKLKLISTRDHTIVEDIGKRNGEKHFFWGMKQINGEWIGNNMMGKLLMQLRERYQQI